MGGCGSKVHADGMVQTKQTKATNKQIEERMLQDAEEERRIIKCLLLGAHHTCAHLLKRLAFAFAGAGECGKSTILKQMRILHLNGFSKEERVSVYRNLIRKNTLDAIYTLCEAIDKQLHLVYENPENKVLRCKTHVVSTMC